MWLPIANELGYKILLYCHLSVSLRLILKYAWNIISADPFPPARFTQVAHSGRPGWIHTKMIQLNVIPLGMQHECCLSSQYFNDALQSLVSKHYLHLNEEPSLLYRGMPPTAFSWAQPKQRLLSTARDANLRAYRVLIQSIVTFHIALFGANECYRVAAVLQSDEKRKRGKKTKKNSQWSSLLSKPSISAHLSESTIQNLLSLDRVFSG